MNPAKIFDLTALQQPIQKFPQALNGTIAEITITTAADA